MSSRVPIPEHPSPGQPSHPRLITVFVVVFLAIQALLPLRFYLLERFNDERFAWRMFSSIRMSTYSAKVNRITTKDGKTVLEEIDTGLPNEWALLINRTQGGLVERYLRWRFKSPGASQVSYEIRGKATDGRLLPIRRWTLDQATGLIKTQEFSNP